MNFERELDFEAALIQKLYTDGGWEPEVLRYQTEEDLIQNWANILFENNRDIDRLNDAPLTRGEMQQILEEIARLRTPLKLNGFINGKSVMITRDNPDDKLKQFFRSGDDFVGIVFADFIKSLLNVLIRKMQF